ncbi:MAG: nucleotidyltransferase family protein [Anaerolineaceae bacterium]|nr:nucleotidyltransferase family protein [Anaerolineaceae bacterium]
MIEKRPPIGAVVLAAGMSTRMGRSKLSMPWGKSSVIGKVIDTLVAASVEPILVVVGGHREIVIKLLAGTPVVIVDNPNFKNGEMLESLQVGLRSLPEDIAASLMVLGDQPQILESTVRDIMSSFQQDKPRLIVPSYQRKRGHPWLIPKNLWEEILNFKPPLTLRDFLNNNTEKIEYLNVSSDSVLQDLDTPEDYQKFRPSDRVDDKE